VTPETINFMATIRSRIDLLAYEEETTSTIFAIGPMTAEKNLQLGTAFCEAIDARDGVTTESRIYDARARTIQVAIDPADRPADLARPGHVFPLRARKGGVLVRAGQTEPPQWTWPAGGTDPRWHHLAKSCVDDGTMARVLI